MNKIKRDILKEQTKNILLDIAELIVIFLFAYIFNKWIEMIVYVMTFSIIRSEFTKAVHGTDFTKSACKGIKYCRYITFSIQVISLIFIITIDKSKYINLILAFILGIINFFAKDYLQYALNKRVFYRGMKENELPKDLNNIEYEIMFKYYVKREKLDKIALDLNYSPENISKKKAKIKERYS